MPRLLGPPPRPCSPSMNVRTFLQSLNPAPAADASLYPDIHVCLSAASASTEIPIIFAGQVPPENPENVGSKNYAQLPAAVVFGGGYPDDEFDAVRKACEGKSSVPFLKFDPSKPTPPLGPEYGIYVAGRLKARLQELESQGHFGKDAVFLW